MTTLLMTSTAVKQRLWIFHLRDTICALFFYSTVSGDVSAGSFREVQTPGPMTTPQMTSTAVKQRRMEQEESDLGSEADFDEQ